MAQFTPTLVPAAALPYARLTKLINQAYADYYVPVQLDRAQFMQMCVEEDIAPDKSVVAMAGDQPVGLTLFSVREKEGWVSGVGVLSSWRRQGIARKMLQKIKAIAKTDGLQTVWLEMLTQNQAGASLYRQMGFEWVRDLLVMSLDAEQVPPTERHPNIGIAPVQTLLAFYPAFHDVRVPWQRSLRSLQSRAPKLRGLGYWAEERLLGYILYESRGDTFAIYDVAVTPDAPQRVEIAQHLLVALHAARTDIGSYIINFPTEDPLASAFLNLPYRIWQRQHEMAWQVK